jgi:3',5'-cyclic AMP phosphodiesterase CpdA
VADTHLFHEGLVVPDGDVLVHAGDLCRHGDLDELRRAADWLVSLPHRHKTHIQGILLSSSWNLGLTVMRRASSRLSRERTVLAPGSNLPSLRSTTTWSRTI